MPGTTLFGSNAACLDLGVIVGDVVVEGHSADLVQRVVAVWPHLGQVKGIEPVGLCILERHDLHLECPTREVAVLDGLVEVALVRVAVTARQLVTGFLGQELDALVGLEVVLHPEHLAGRVQPAVGVAGVAVHVPPRLRNATVPISQATWCADSGTKVQKSPLHVVVAEVRRLQPLLAADEVLELHRVTDEEDRRVVADEVEVALGGVELQRETRGSRQVSGLPRSPATVENRATISVLVPGWNTAARVYWLTSLVTSKWPKAPRLWRAAAVPGCAPG